MADAREQRRIVDLVAVEIQNRQHRAVTDGIEKFVDVPGSGERPGFRFAVTDHGGDDQVRIVEGRAAGMRQHVAEFASFMNRAGRFGRAVTADAARKRELLEEAEQTFFVLALVRIDFRVSAFEIDRPEHAGRAVTRARP